MENKKYNKTCFVVSTDIAGGWIDYNNARGFKSKYGILLSNTAHSEYI